MSRAFVNEDEHQELPFVPPRADLPVGVPNYVTPEGYEMLQNEKQTLLDEFKTINDSNEADKLFNLKVINIKLQMLEKRLLSAQLVDTKLQDKSVVRFGSKVLLQLGKSNKTRALQLVGVDEADLKQGKIAFTSPLGNLLMNKRVGETVILKLKENNSEFKILEIE